MARVTQSPICGGEVIWLPQIGLSLVPLAKDQLLTWSGVYNSFLQLNTIYTVTVDYIQQ